MTARARHYQKRGVAHSKNCGRARRKPIARLSPGLTMVARPPTRRRDGRTITHGSLRRPRESPGEDPLPAFPLSPLRPRQAGRSVLLQSRQRRAVEILALLLKIPRVRADIVTVTKNVSAPPAAGGGTLRSIMSEKKLGHQSARETSSDLRPRSALVTAQTTAGHLLRPSRREPRN